jgi:chromosome partitioning protein
MPVVAVVNRKGGSGKSTLATHLAAHCANRGIPVMLGDVDRQQSTQTWLRLRSTQTLPRQRAPITSWVVDARNVLRPPSGIRHVILDTPGGLKDSDLARVVMAADAIVMPLCDSVFDRDSAAQCHAELMNLPRVASGRCKLAVVGMRVDARTKAGEVLRQWADDRDLPFLGVLRDTQAYVRCVEHGLTLFDLPPSKAEADMQQWAPILEWLEPVFLNPVPVPTPEDVPLLPVRPIATADSPRPTATARATARHAGSAEESASRLAAHMDELRRKPRMASAAGPARRGGWWQDLLSLPRFLQRNP